MVIHHRRSLKTVLRATTALLGWVAAAGLFSQPAAAVVINDNYTPSEIVDTTNITGVGQMVVDQLDGYIGLCTATLINPRTVIFAAHCVNTNADDTAFRPNTAYDAQSGGVPIAFFFNADNNQRGNSAIGHWLYGVSGSPSYETRTQDNAYNSNYVVYDTNCCTLGLGLNFLQADIAMAALDTPAVGIPAWTLLFSPLSEATHATITGYGINGTGTTGSSGGIDYRRRVAENTISLLGSMDDLDTSFGGTPNGLPQNLYMMDFNDPKFGTAQANSYDFNIFHDAALQKEGITASGDSGGPLIVDQLFSAPVIAAVLSGGSWFFGDQPGSSYGTTSFYQPLYLYWDWIVANNPYKYVSAKAGNASWFDPNHWVIDLDPNYVTIVDGQLVNALPTTPAQGIPAVDGANTPKFGNVCFFDTCVDIATGKKTTYGADSISLSGLIADGPAKVALEALGSTLASSQTTSSPSQLTLVRSMLASRGYDEQLSAEARLPPEGSATASGETVQGAPGSSGFIPQDTDGNRYNNTPARYYDVTLWNAGTTTLDNGIAIVDRLTINGATTRLTVGSNGGLGSLIDTTMFAGNFQVDGIFISLGDMALMGGVLSGSGAVLAPYTTAVLGAIAPGSVGTTGNLTILGNVVLSSGSGLLIDMSPTETDRLDVYGELSVGGTAVFTPVGGFVPRWHNSAVFATGTTITGAFDHVPDTIVGVLYPTVSFVTDNSGAYQEAVVRFEAATFASLLTNATNDQLQVGHALDISRDKHYAGMTALYDAIDPLADGALSAGLENLAPDNARALPLVSQLLIQGYSGFIWQHLGQMSTAGGDQTVFQVQTGALKMTQNSSTGSYEVRGLMTELSHLGGGPASALAPASPTRAQGGTMVNLPKGMGGFLSGSTLDGSVAVGGGGGKAEVDGFIIAGGIDLPLGEKFRAGVSISLAQATAWLQSSPGRTNTNSFQAVAYASYDAGDGWFVQGFAGDSGQAMNLRRDVVVGATTFHFTGHTTGNSPMGGLQVSKFIDVQGIRLAPAVGMQYQRSDVAGYTETGGVAAMTVAPYAAEEFDLRAGFDAYGSIDLGGIILKPNLHAFLVGNVDGAAAGLQSAFVGAPGSVMSFALAPTASTWAELGVGAQVDVSDGVTFGVHYNADVGRSDSRYGAWTGSLRVVF